MHIRITTAVVAAAAISSAYAEEAVVQYESRVPNGASVLLCGEKPRLFGLMCVLVALGGNQ